MATPPSTLAGSLQRFRLDGIRDTGITVGDGAYATVLQYDFLGLKCVGKKIHRLLYEHASPPQKADMLRRFEEECKLLGRLLHPNIVQFLGVHIETGSELPVLVMEYLPTNLSGYLDRHGVLSTEISYGILRDVALGLHYLHKYSPPIVHRDLSANNVLLTASLSAKISDLGVAKIINITPSLMTQKMSTKAPGTPCYMPPEALVAQPSYTKKIDSYSFGVMVLHLLCGEWPFPDDPFQRDPHNPSIFVPVTEVDRRAEFLLKMGSDHPLSGLVCQCLSNAPDERPESTDILQQINTALSQIPTPAETVFQQLEGLRSENQRLVTELQRVSHTFRGEIERLDTENQSLMSENQRIAADIRRQANDLLTLGSEVQRLEISNQGFRNEKQTLKEHSQNQPSCSGTAVEQPLTCEVERLSVRDLGPPVRAATSSTESQHHPGVKLQWRRCADAPAEIIGAQVVVVGENVYVGGGGTTTRSNVYQAFRYNRREDTWSTLPHSPVKWFSMSHFMGRVITVGGVYQDTVTGKIHALNEESQKWEEFLSLMPTARFFLSVATTSSSIIAAGGDTSIRSPTRSSAVEVYSSDTAQWHIADPLPTPQAWMSSVTIDNVWYLLGGRDQSNSATKNCWCTFLPSLIRKAILTTPQYRSIIGPVWNHLPPTPLSSSTAACLSGSLVAVGGADGTNGSPAVYTFLKSKEVKNLCTWVRLSNGDLLSPRSYCGTAQLSPMEMIVIGGWDEDLQQSKTVFIATLQSQ